MSYYNRFKRLILGDRAVPSSTEPHVEIRDDSIAFGAYYDEDGATWRASDTEGQFLIHKDNSGGVNSWLNISYAYISVINDPVTFNLGIRLSRAGAIDLVGKIDAEQDLNCLGIFAAKQRQHRAVTASDYTITDEDYDVTLLMNHATGQNLWLDEGSSYPVGFEGRIVQYGAGPTTILKVGAGETIHTLSGTKTNGQYSMAGFLRDSSTSWLIWGINKDLTT
jgi:hypothetical protein